MDLIPIRKHAKAVSVGMKAVLRARSERTQYVVTNCVYLDDNGQAHAPPGVGRPVKTTDQPIITSLSPPQ